MVCFFRKAFLKSDTAVALIVFNNFSTAYLPLIVLNPIKYLFTKNLSYVSTKFGILNLNNKNEQLSASWGKFK
jgi:hypothetical protein